ncbi:Fanconi anemia core complex-associated protein 100 isoform X1 [Alosa pseudoharengus]|uniref:Fanconi anemia core complex-associated protein 100 isoform X1 n=2 Tax=Alosa pseudoharengus TaxID=34774 RepID=UPI003F895D6F
MALGWNGERRTVKEMTDSGIRMASPRCPGAMEAIRCSVESWAEFGLSNSANVKILLAGTTVLFCSGSDILLFSSKDKRLSAVLQFDTPVTHLAFSARRYIYVLCEKGGIYCTSIPQQSRPPSPIPVVDQDPVLQRVAEDSILLKDPTIDSFLLAEDLLITVSREEATWTLGLYRVSDGSSSKPVSLRKLAEHRVSAINTAQPHRKTEVNVDGKDTWTVLSCIYPSGGASLPGDLSGSPGCFLLEPDLFTLLFGVDAALVSSPVVLLGLPDGRLCYLPLRIPTSSAPGQRAGPRVLHSLEQPVAFIGTSSVATGTGGCLPRSLVAIGQTGRVLLVTANEGGGEGKVARFSEFSIRGPVVCACHSSSHVYYSTATDLLSLKLNAPSASSSSSDQPGLPDPPTPTPISLNVCGVIAMTLASSDLTEGGAVELLALSRRGRLQKIRLPQGTTGGSVARLPSSLAGQRVKDLLAGIGNVWERASALKNTVQHRNKNLRLLNQVLNICSLMTNQKAEKQACDHQQPINCHGVTSWSCVLQNDSLMLTCTLENNSAFALEHGWSLCVHIYHMSGSFTAERENPSRTYTFPVQKLSPGQKLDVTLPLGSSHSLSLPLTVHCSLMFSMCSLGSPEDPNLPENTGIQPSSLPIRQSNCICLHLNTLTVDLLDALHFDASMSLSSVSKQPPAPLDAVHTLLDSRGTVRGDPTGQGQRSSPYSAVVKLSVELLRASLKAPGVDAGAGEPGPSVSALRWLLNGCPGARGLVEALQMPAVTGRCPAGHTARMTIKEVTLSDVSIEGPLTVLEILIESFSMATVCGLHYAVLRRIRALPRLIQTCHKPHMQLGEDHMRRAMQRAEALYKALQEALLPTALGVCPSSIRTSHRLLSIYQQLRENPMLIL